MEQLSIETLRKEASKLGIDISCCYNNKGEIIRKLKEHGYTVYKNFQQKIKRMRKRRF